MGDKGFASKASRINQRKIVQLKISDRFFLEVLSVVLDRSPLLEMSGITDAGLEIALLCLPFTHRGCRGPSCV